MNVDISNIAKSLGRALEPHETGQAQWWIQGAQLRIQAKLGDLAKLNQETLTYVITEAVARKLRNPDGKRNERIDDYSYGYDADAARVDIDLTDTEWEMLKPIKNANAFTIGTNSRPYYARGGELWD